MAAPQLNYSKSARRFSGVPFVIMRRQPPTFVTLSISVNKARVGSLESPQARASYVPLSITRSKAESENVIFVASISEYVNQEHSGIQLLCCFILSSTTPEMSRFVIFTNLSFTAMCSDNLELPQPTIKVLRLSYASGNKLVSSQNTGFISAQLAYQSKKPLVSLNLSSQNSFLAYSSCAQTYDSVFASILIE